MIPGNENEPISFESYLTRQTVEKHLGILKLPGIGRFRDIPTHNDQLKLTIESEIRGSVSHRTGKTSPKRFLVVTRKSIVLPEVQVGEM